jgi:hypothetical protein
MRQINPQGNDPRDYDLRDNDQRYSSSAPSPIGMPRASPAIFRESLRHTPGAMSTKTLAPPRRAHPHPRSGSHPQLQNALRAIIPASRAPATHSRADPAMQPRPIRGGASDQPRIVQFACKMRTLRRRRASRARAFLSDPSFPMPARSSFPHLCAVFALPNIRFSFPRSRAIPFSLAGGKRTSSSNNPEVVVRKSSISSSLSRV